MLLPRPLLEQGPLGLGTVWGHPEAPGWGPSCGSCCFFLGLSEQLGSVIHAVLQATETAQRPGVGTCSA